MTRTAPRICPLCEATCGLTLTIGRDRTTGGEIVTAARGDADDVFSAGYLCPKGASFAQLDNDPDRLDRPLIRRDGRLLHEGTASAPQLHCDPPVRADDGIRPNPKQPGCAVPVVSR